MGPIKVVMLTTLGHKLAMLMLLLPKNRLFDDLLEKTNDFDALGYPVVCIKPLQSVGEANAF